MVENKWIILKDIARIEIRVGDINYGGHMGNDKALLVFHDARISFLRRLGYTESDIGGPGIIMRDARVEFKKEVFLGDILRVDVGIEVLSLTSFNMTYSVKRENDGVVVFTGNTTLVAFDYTIKRPVKLPDEFLEKIEIKHSAK